MATIGSLVVNLVANTAGFSSGLAKGTKEAKVFEGTMASVASGINRFAGAMGLAIGASEFVGFLKSCSAEAMDAENNLAQLNAVLKSTGGVARVSAEDVLGLAESMQAVSKFEADDIVKAQSLLLTFTSVADDNFATATKAAADMSQALGQDLNASIMQIGKALSDPVKGIAALKKVGVTFTDDQNAMAKALVATGDAAGAQRIILAELAKEFGGSAAASAETFSGQLTIMGNNWKDFKQSIGEGIGEIPGVASWVKSVNEGMNPSKRLLKNKSTPGQYGGLDARQIREMSGGALPGDIPKVAAGKTFKQKQTDILIGNINNVDTKGAKSEKDVVLAYDIAAKGFSRINDEASKYFDMSVKAAIDEFRKEKDKTAAELKDKKKYRGLSDAIGDAFSANFIGKNRANLGMVGQGQFDKWSKGSKPQDKPIKVIMERELTRGSSPFGGDRHFETMAASRGSKVSELAVTTLDVQKRQLTALEFIANQYSNARAAGIPIP